MRSDRLSPALDAAAADAGLRRFRSGGSRLTARSSGSSEATDGLFFRTCSARYGLIREHSYQIQHRQLQKEKAEENRWNCAPQAKTVVEVRSAGSGKQEGQNDH